MADSVIDYAGLDAAASTTADTTVVETPATETTETVETPSTDKTAETTETKTVTEGKEKIQKYNSDGSPVEEKVEDDGKEFGEKTPQEIRRALSAFKKTSPEAAKMAQQLHGSYERWEAAKAIYPGGIAEIKAAKEFSDLVGGHEGLEALQGVKTAAEASD